MDESEEKRRKGRLSKAVKVEAFAIRRRYQEELEALAKRSGKNLSTLLEVVGDVVPDNRSLNPWNAFQQYAVHPDGLGMRTGVNRTEAQLKEEIRKRYSKLQDGEVEPGKLDLDGIMDWYRTEMAHETVEERTRGYTRKEIEKLCLPFINRSNQLYEARGLCGIGWLVDPVSALAVPWGSDPLYIAMRDANPAQITAQAVDYGSMFHNQLMVQSQSNAGLDPEKQVLVNRFMEDGNNKVVLRGLLKDVLLWSLRDTRPNKDFKQMKWGSAFADLCFQEKIKLVNYPADLKPIGPPDGITGAALVPVHHMKTIVKQYVRFWQQEAREKKAIAAKERDVTSLFDDDDDVSDPNGHHKVFLEDLVRFVPWSDDEKQFSLKHQANIGILLQKPQGDDDPVVLTRVLHSKVFLKRAAARQIKIQLPKEMQKGGEESDREKTSDDDPKSSTEDSDSSEDDTVPQSRNLRNNVGSGSRGHPKSQRSRPKDSRKSQVEDVGSSDEDMVSPLRKSRNNVGSGSRGEPNIQTRPINPRKRLQPQTEDVDSGEDDMVRPLRKLRGGSGLRGPKITRKRLQKRDQDSDDSEDDVVPGQHHIHSKKTDKEQRPRPRPRMIPPGGTRTIIQGPVLSPEETDESLEERPKKRARIEKKDRSRKRKRDA
ncbi:hypothetical protein EV361DRAFT_956580 [Lentinula raphanica]|nr:hypothetical protein EV361DRAFT_956580 [Lentinula raphanica]